MRMIDADELFKKLSTLSVDGSNLMGQGYLAGISDVSCLIVNAPTIDPVKHGRWIGMNSDYANKYETLFFYHCSECQQEVDEYGVDNYCSHCGARMDGDSE